MQKEIKIDNPSKTSVIIDNDRLKLIIENKITTKFSILQLNHSSFMTEEGECEILNFVSHEGEQITIFENEHSFKVLSSLTEQDEIEFWKEHYARFERIAPKTFNY